MIIILIVSITGSAILGLIVIVRNPQSAKVCLDLLRIWYKRKGSDDDNLERIKEIVTVASMLGTANAKAPPNERVTPPPGGSWFSSSTDGNAEGKKAATTAAEVPHDGDAAPVRVQAPQPSRRVSNPSRSWFSSFEDGVAVGAVQGNAVRGVKGKVKGKGIRSRWFE